MRKYRHGGYEALPVSLQKRIDVLGAPLPLRKWFSPYSTAGLVFGPLLCLIICAGGLLAITLWVPDAVESFIHLGGRAYKFADVPVGTAPIFALLAGMCLSGVLSAIFYSRGHRSAEAGARTIRRIEMGDSSNSQSERAFQNFILDRTEDNLNPDDFLTEFFRQSGRTFMYVAMPLLLLTGAFLILDMNTFKRLALEGYRTSGYFQMGSTLHPLSSLTRIEAGCRPHHSDNGELHAHLRYVLYFEGGASLDLYDRDLQSNYDRLHTIEAYDKLLTDWGMKVTAKHLQPEDASSPVDMAPLCDAAVVKRYKPKFHDRARTFLHLPVPSAEQSLQAQAHSGSD